MTSHTEWRSSSAFVTLVVCVAIFTDIFLYGLVVPVLPFALKVRIGLPENDIQFWASAFLAIYGGSIFLGSCTCQQPILKTLKHSNVKYPNPQYSSAG